MKNSMTDLNNHLFAQLERLGDEDLKPEELEKEVERSKAITSVAKTIAENAKVELEAHKLAFAVATEGLSLPSPSILGRGIAHETK